MAQTSSPQTARQPRKIVTYTWTLNNPSFTRASDGGKMPNTGGWQDRHISALRVPTTVEQPIYGLLQSWAQYADRHRVRYEDGIGHDGVLGPAWAAVGAAIRRLLDGETGRFDCGTLASFICDTLSAEGFEPDAL